MNIHLFFIKILFLVVIFSYNKLLAFENDYLLDLLKSHHIGESTNYFPTNQYNEFYYLKKGINLLNESPQASLNNFEKALEGNFKKIKPIVKLYQARAHYNLSEYDKAYKILKKISSNKNIGPKRAIELKRLFLQTTLKLKKEVEFIRLIDKYNKRHKNFLMFENFYLDAIAIYEKNSQYTKMFSYLEKLSEEYPITKNSQIAFKKLIEYTCPLNKPKYYFNYNLLRKMSRNKEIDPPLKDFLVLASYNKIKQKSKVINLNKVERIKYFIDLKFYQDALRLGQESLKDSYLNLEDKQKITTLLGVVHSRLYEHQNALHYFSFSKTMTSNRNQNIKLNRYLANTLSYVGYKDMASYIYRKIAPKANRKDLRWKQFWNIYSNNNLTEAASLFNLRKKYVPPRDSFQPHGSKYWQARVFEKQKHITQANKIYKNILTKNSDDIYGIFISHRHPEILIPENNSFAKKTHARNPQLNKLLTLDTFSTLSIKKENPLYLLVNFYKFGLFNEAKKELYNIKISSLGFENLLLMGMVSKKLNDHHIQFKTSRRVLLKHLKKRINWFEITHHQSQYTEIWKNYFPIAYKDILYKVSDILKIDPFFLLSIMRTESHYKESSISYVGARGLMQIMPYTAIEISNRLNHKNFNLGDMWNPDNNIVFGSWYLSFLLRRFHDNFILAAAAYNAGPFAVHEWMNRCNGCSSDEFIESIPYKETRKYVKNVIRSLTRYHRIYKSRQQLGIAKKIPTGLPANNDFF